MIEERHARFSLFAKDTPFLAVRPGKHAASASLNRKQCSRHGADRAAAPRGKATGLPNRRLDVFGLNCLVPLGFCSTLGSDRGPKC
jgi:hypothetical protein